MVFDPVSGGLKCPACGGTKAVENAAENAAIAEIPFEGAFDPGILSTLSASAVQVNCTGCGSIVEFQPPEVAGNCPFCASPIVAQPKSADPHIAPAAVLPFAVPKDKASTMIRNWLGSLWFAPGGLQKLAQQDTINGVYLPFWTYDAQTVTGYTGQRGDYYHETEYFMETDANGRSSQRSRQVRKTRWSYASGRVGNEFDDLLVCASKAVQRDKVRACEPWDLPSLVPYEPAYLAGFKAQRYQIDLKEGWEEAKRLMVPAIDNAIRHHIGGDEQSIQSRDIQYYGVTFKHILMPAWIGAYRFQGRVFQVIINARTGEVQGERPYSTGKIVLLIACILLAIFILIQISK